MGRGEEKNTSEHERTDPQRRTPIAKHRSNSLLIQPIGQNRKSFCENGPKKVNLEEKLLLLGEIGASGGLLQFEDFYF